MPAAEIQTELCLSKAVFSPLMNPSTFSAGTVIFCTVFGQRWKQKSLQYFWLREQPVPVQLWLSWDAFWGKKIIILQKSGQALEPAAQGGGGATIPGGV